MIDSDDGSWRDRPFRMGMEGPGRSTEFRPVSDIKRPEPNPDREYYKPGDEVFSLGRFHALVERDYPPGTAYQYEWIIAGRQGVVAEWRPSDLCVRVRFTVTNGYGTALSAWTHGQYFDHVRDMRAPRYTAEHAADLDGEEWEGHPLWRVPRQRREVGVQPSTGPVMVKGAHF